MTTGSDNNFPKLLLDNQTSDPSAPSGDDWKVYAKAGGVYSRSSNTIYGPFLDPELTVGRLKLPTGTGNLPYTEGQVGWQSTRKQLRLNDGQRERNIGASGWQPAAYPLVYDPGAALSTALNLPANGGSIAIPIMVLGHMSSRGISVLNTDTSATRTCEIRLFQQRLNAGNTSENTLDEVPGTDGTDSFTASGASQRGITFSGLPVYLGPGVYWLVLRNTSASQTWGLGSTATGTTFRNSAQTKTLGSSLTTSLDFVAATWTKVTAIYGVCIVGNVFGQLSSF